MTYNLKTMDEKDSLKLKTFGEKLKKIRIEHSISQEELASITNLDRTYISGLERGLRNPSYLILLRITKALNISPQVLFE